MEINVEKEQAPKMDTQVETNLAAEVQSTPAKDGLNVDTAIKNVADQEKATDTATDTATSKKQWQSFETFSKEIAEMALFAKVDSCLHYMKHALSITPSPKFTDFWTCRKFVGPLLEDVESKSQRDTLKESVNDLVVEARGLKMLLEEQLRLSLESVETSLSSLEHELLPSEESASTSEVISLDKEGESEPVSETDLAQVAPDASSESTDTHSQEQHKSEQHSEKPELDIYSLESPDVWTFDKWPVNFAKIDEYAHLQGLIEWSTRYTAAIQELRREIMQIAMRLGQKNKLLARLSKVGDSVFPVKKAAIQALSKLFIKDLKDYLNQFPKTENELPKAPLFKLRAEIQTLQSLAKTLGINTSSFKNSREILSTCWNHLKQFDKILVQKREIGEKNSQAELEKLTREIENIKRQQGGGSLSEELVLKRLKGLENQAKKIRLSKTDQASFFEQISQVRTPIFEKQNKEFEESNQLRQQRGVQRNNRVSHFKVALGDHVDSLAADKSKAAGEIFSMLLSKMKEVWTLKDQWEQCCSSHSLLPSERSEMDISFENAALDLVNRISTALHTQPSALDEESVRGEFIPLFDAVCQTLDSSLEKRKAEAGLDFQLVLALNEKKNTLESSMEAVQQIID